MKANCMSRGSVLASGDSLTSINGLNVLTMQSDGNLVLQYDSITTWATNTSGAGNYLVFAEDGTITINNTNGTVVATISPANSGVFLIAQNDGNLVEYTEGTPVFASNTNR